jgi:hypothetical protein
MLVRSPHRRGPKAESGSTSRPSSGCPTDPWLVGPRRTVLYRGGGGHGSQYKVLYTATHLTYNPSNRGSTRAAGSTTIAAADVLLHHPYTLPSSSHAAFPHRREHPSITGTRCHHPHLRCFPTATLTEPAPSWMPLRPRSTRWPTHRQRLPPLLMVGVLLLPLLVLLLVFV